MLPRSIRHLAWLPLLMLAEERAPTILEREPPPNVLLLIADDLGYADLGCHGARDVVTPHLDSIARHGVRFSNAYVTASVCSPSRAGLFTGRYPQRFGFEDNPGPGPVQGETIGLPATERTLAEALQAEAYATGYVGKWHLGVASAFHPLRHGFDEFFGFLQGGHVYYGPDRSGPLVRDLRCVSETEYLTDAFTREAIGFLDRHHEEPFFLCVSYSAVHEPLVAPPRVLEGIPDDLAPSRREYLGALQVLDEGVGRILAALERLDLNERTLVVFLSDNGGQFFPHRFTARNAPGRRGKNTLGEGGIHIPLLLHLPGTIEGGGVFEAPVSTLDLLPTILACGEGEEAVDGSGLDGVNLLPFLRGDAKGVPHERLFWRRQEQYAIRQGPWKLVHDASEGTCLYHLDDDPSETRDRSAEHPELKRELADAWEAWSRGLADPAWDWNEQIRRAVRGDFIEPHPAAYLEGFAEYEASLGD